MRSSDQLSSVWCDKLWGGHADALAVLTLTHLVVEGVPGAPAQVSSDLRQLLLPARLGTTWWR